MRTAAIQASGAHNTDDVAPSRDEPGSTGPERFK